MSTSAALMLLPLMGGPAPAETPVLSPDARAAVAPERTFDLTQLGLDLELLPEERAVSGRATYTVRRLWEGPAVLDAVALDIQAVDGPEGALPWHVDGDTVVVELPGDFAGTEPETFSISWRATPRTGLHFREAGRGSPDRWAEVWSQGEGEDNRHWFPSWDHPGDRFIYQGRVTAPDGWRVLTNSGLDMVNYLVMVAAGPYEIVAHDQRPEVELWLPPGTGDAAAARVLDPVPAMMDHLAERTGVAYPWGSYRQVFVQRFLFTGMENSSATVMHERLLVDDSVGPTRPWIESIVAHELAHQWYGDLLTCVDWRELWLNEGFATFFAADWMATRLGPESHAASVQGWLRGARDQARPLAGRFFHGPEAGRNHNVYGRGAAVLHMLRVYLGEDRFWAGIRSYTQANQRGLVETVDLQRALEAVSGRDLDWFFQQWVELGNVPEISVSRSWSEGRLSVVVKQQLDDDTPRFTLPITVEIGVADGSVLRRQGWLDDEELTLETELAERPLWVAFDPDGGIIAELSYDQDPAAWQAQLASPTPLARRTAILALGQTDQGDALERLLADASRPVAERTVAAVALGDQRRAEPLVSALRDADDRVRLAAATALGRAADPSPAGALRRIVERDANADVRAAALTSLAALRSDLALTVARPLVRRLSSREERGLRQSAADVLGQHGDASDLAALLDERAPARLRNTGLSAAARIAAREEGTSGERLRRRVARAAEPLLDDLDLRTRQHAIGVLAEVGDDSSVHRLEAYRRQETVAEVAEAARRAVRDIRSRRAPQAVPAGQAEARLDELEARLDELERQLEKDEHRH